MNQMDYDIFISYSKKDTEKLLPLREALSRTNIKYWIDDEINGSKNFLKEITVAIQNSKIILFVASKNSASSLWTQREILYANNLNKPIYPYRLGDFNFDSCPELDFFFTNVQWKDSVDIVICDLLKMLNKETTDNEINTNNKSHQIRDEIDLLAIPDEEFDYFYNGEKYGYKLKSTGKVVIPCKYNSFSNFYNGYAKVEINGKVGIIDKRGNEIVPIKYYDVEYIREGLIIVCTRNKIEKEGWTNSWVYKYGVLNSNGQEIVAPKYDNAYSFSEGLAVVKLNGKYGYIDMAGNEVIPPKYDDAYSFSGGIAIIATDKKYGFIDNTGKVVIPLEYDDAEDFEGNFAWVKIDGKWNLIDRNGELYKIDPLFIDVARAAISNGNISYSFIQKYAEVGFNRAGRILEQLKRTGFVVSRLDDNNKPKEVIQDISRLQKFENKLCNENIDEEIDEEEQTFLCKIIYLIKRMFQ